MPHTTTTSAAVTIEANAASPRPPGPARIPYRTSPRCDTSEEVERAFPHATQVIRRGHWMVYEQAEVNAMLHGLGEHRSGCFNGIGTFRFTQAEHAAAFAEYALDKRLHRLKANSTHGATREEVALEWERRAAEREEILAWGRITGMTRQVVAHYRAERHVGTWSWPAHLAAARLIEKAHPTVTDPCHYAGVMIEWAEREHRSWFWRCCRGLHQL
jgi:hypothetical protein